MKTKKKPIKVGNPLQLALKQKHFHVNITPTKREKQNKMWKKHKERRLEE